MKELNLKTRREFLRSTVLGGAITWTVPAFLSHTFNSLQAEALNSSQPVTGKDGTILVVLQLAGGNDGLNTVIPHSNDYYQKARPSLGIKANLLKLNDQFALHPALEGLKEIYDAGDLSVIHGIGYPNPNRSHFRSTEIWQTASDSEKFERYGWLGRYFDNACAGSDPTVGVNIGRQMPQAFAAKHPIGVSLENPESYRFISSEKGRRDVMSSSEESYRKLNQPDDEMLMATGGEGNSGTSIGSIHGATRHTGSALDFLERTALDAQVSSDKI